MTTTLKGWVYNDNGTVAPNLTVTCYDQVPNTIGTTSTDPNGMWTFTGLTDGITYDVKVNNNNNIVRWIKGGEMHQVAALNLTGNYSTAATWNFTGVLTVPFGAGLAPTTQAAIALNTTTNFLDYGDGTANHALVTLDQTQTISGAKTFSATLTGAAATFSGLITGNAGVSATSGSFTGTLTASGGASVSGGAGIPLTVVGPAGNWTANITSANSGVQDGLLVIAGSSSSDYTSIFYNRAQTATPLLVRGDGYVSLGNSAQIQIGPGATAAALASPNINGTVSGSASYTSPTLTGTVSGSATYATPTLSDPLIGNTTNQGVVPYYGTATQTLPTPSGNMGKLRFYKGWGGTLTINSNSGSQLIGPGVKSTTGVQASFVLQDGDSATFYCDGSYWWGL